MPKPREESAAAFAKPENLLMRVERLRRQAEAFQKQVEDEARTVHALLESANKSHYPSN